MQVVLKLATAKEPKPTVHVDANINFTTLEGLDKAIAAIKVGRRWLAKELGK